MGYAVVAAVVLFTLFGLARFAEIVRRHRERQERAERGVPDAEPVQKAPPRSARTRRQAWFAVAGGDASEAARTLGLRTVRRVSWDEASASAQEGLFAVAATRGHVLLVGVDAFARGDLARIDEALRRLAKTHGEATWFCFDEELDLCGFGRARRGEVERAFCWNGRDDEVLWEVGEPTADELALGFFAADPRDGSDDEVKWWPLPRDVRALARRWALDPEAAPAGPKGPVLAGRW